MKPEGYGLNLLDTTKDLISKELFLDGSELLVKILVPERMPLSTLKFTLSL